MIDIYLPIVNIKPKYNKLTKGNCMNYWKIMVYVIAGFIAARQLVKQNGSIIYDVSGKPVGLNRIQENGIYLVGTEIQTARKIVVIK